MSDHTVRIRTAAIRFGPLVCSLPAPNRHHNILHAAADLGVPTYAAGEQGFLTTDCVFVDRVTAAQIALAAGQCVQLTTPPNLYSEDLW